MIHVLMEADIDRDGEISYEEFMLALTDANFFINPQDNIRKAFEKFDSNGDGYLDFDEFKDLIDVKDNLSDQKLVEATFKEYDLDGNGTIEIDEFHDLVI